MRYRWIINEELIIEIERSMDARDVPPTADELDEYGISSHEVSVMRRRVEAPTIAKRLVPQTGRSRLSKDPTFRDLREIDKLEQESYNLPDEQRGGHLREIHKIKERIK